MFDFGFWEIALVGLITLVVVGPEKMPAIARKIGYYVGKIKSFSAKIQDDINQEIDANKIINDPDDGEQKSIKEVITDTQQTLESIKKSIKK